VVTGHAISPHLLVHSSGELPGAKIVTIIASFSTTQDIRCTYPERSRPLNGSWCITVPKSVVIVVDPSTKLRSNLWPSYKPVANLSRRSPVNGDTWFFFHPMIEQNRQLVTNEPVEFEKDAVEAQDCRKITDRFRGIYRVHPDLTKENRRMSTRTNRLDSQTLGSQPISMPKNLPVHCFQGAGENSITQEQRTFPC
jgi:hypothetical protein